MRCFIAVDVSPEVRDALAAVQRRLREAAPDADVRWTRPEAIHLTLKFLGEVPEDRVAAVGHGLAGAVTGHADIRLAARRVGAFPNPRRPRIVWAGVSGEVAALGRLAADVERTIAPLGYPSEARPFAAHLTLGRVRTPRTSGDVGAAVEAMRGAVLGAWDVDAVVLYRSHTKPTGAVYEPLARIRLGGES